VSSQELVSAYVDGRISRRTLIRRLVAGGVSLGAAVSYAHLLAPRAHADHPDNLHPEYPYLHINIRDSLLEEVIARGRVRTTVRSADPADLILVATTRKAGKDIEIGRREISFTEPGLKRARIGIDTLAPLRRRRRARVNVFAFSRERFSTPLVAVGEKILV
jgi:hypothetical protein